MDRVEALQATEDAGPEIDNPSYSATLNTLCIRSKKTTEERFPMDSLCIRTENNDENGENDEDDAAESESKLMDPSD